MLKTHRLGVTALGLCLLTTSVLASVYVPIEYHDAGSMLRGSASFGAVAVLPGMIGWGLLKRRELARRAGVLLFSTVGLLVAVLGIVYVGFSVRLYRSLLVGTIFCLLAIYLHHEQVRREFASKDIQTLTLS
jgi:hypothetical protein